MAPLHSQFCHKRVVDQKVGGSSPGATSPWSGHSTRSSLSCHVTEARLYVLMGLIRIKKKKCRPHMNLIQITDSQLWWKMVETFYSLYSLLYLSKNTQLKVTLFYYG